MGRKLEFDKAHALEKIMQSFWADGYKATSMRDISQCLGVHLGSVYNALGDKERVFEAALKLHFDRHLIPGLRALAGAENALQGLREYLHQLVADCGDKKNHPGCFLINSLLEITNINDSINATLRDYFTYLEDTLSACIARAQKQGAARTGLDPREAGRAIMGLLFSLRVMAKLGLPQSHLQAASDTLLQGIAA